LEEGQKDSLKRLEWATLEEMTRKHCGGTGTGSGAGGRRIGLGKSRRLGKLKDLEKKEKETGSPPCIVALLAWPVSRLPPTNETGHGLLPRWKDGVMNKGGSRGKLKT